MIRIRRSDQPLLAAQASAVQSDLNCSRGLNVRPTFAVDMTFVEQVAKSDFIDIDSTQQAPAFRHGPAESFISSISQGRGCLLLIHTLLLSQNLFVIYV
ncbi:MAG: hypothetical protein H6905_06120 [Hyphomicrobiales bacterium]|nr:hypothetical protein [Hyphomicrobiales bacterium]